MHKYFWLLLLMFISGCIKPQYNKQYVDIPETWRMKADEGSTLCNYHWWEQFQDPVLNKLIMIAIMNNQDINIAISRVLEFLARYGVIGADQYPLITGSVSYNRLENSVAIPQATAVDIDRTFHVYTAFLNLSWELDFWGRIRSATEAAYAEMLSQVEARRAVVISTVASVARAYIILRGLDSQLNISRKTLESRLNSLKLAQSRFELGETSEIEVKQAASEVEIAAIRVLILERDIPKQENLISILLGENPREIERGLTLESLQYPISIPAGLPSDLLTRRPDIIEAEYNLIATNARVTQARALFFPQITLTGFYGSESVLLKSFLRNPALNWQYTVEAIQTIFDANKRLYALQEVKAVRDEALFNYRQKILTAFREVEDALIDYKKDRELALEHEKQIEVLNDYLRLAKLRYLEGEIDYLNVLDAERQLFDAQLELVAAQVESFNAIVELYSALGGGWVIDTDSMAVSNIVVEEDMQ